MGGSIQKGYQILQLIQLQLLYAQQIMSKQDFKNAKLGQNNAQLYVDLEGLCTVIYCGNNKCVVKTIRKTVGDFVIYFGLLR